jgi:UrcA family protein
MKRDRLIFEAWKEWTQPQGDAHEYRDTTYPSLDQPFNSDPGGFGRDVRLRVHRRAADQPPAPATRQATVSLAGLNLSTPKGARTAYERVKIVAEHLCSQLWNSPYWQTYDSCVHETLANAVGRMNTPALAAVQESHASP